MSGNKATLTNMRSARAEAAGLPRGQTHEFKDAFTPDKALYYLSTQFFHTVLLDEAKNIGSHNLVAIILAMRWYREGSAGSAPSLETEPPTVIAATCDDQIKHIDYAASTDVIAAVPSPEFVRNAELYDRATIALEPSSKVDEELLSGIDPEYSKLAGLQTPPKEWGTPTYSTW
eukprot:439716-Amphidinium_carterae.2